MKHLLTLTAAALLGLGAAAYAEGPQGAAVPHEPLPDAPSDAKSGAASPPAAAGDDQTLARCSDELKSSSLAAGNPASVQEQPDAHAQRVRAVVKLYVAEELAKTKNGKGCLALADQARQLLASTDQPAASGSSR